MIFETTQDYAVIVPLMIANLVSLFVASLLQHEPIYEALAVQDGIHLPTRQTVSGQRRAASIMKPASQLLPAEMTVRDALEHIRPTASSPEAFRTWLVADRRGVIGVLDLARLEGEASADKQLCELIDALAFPHIHADQGLDLALERMGRDQLEILPVVNRADVHKLEGIVTLRDVLDAYGVSRG